MPTIPKKRPASLKPSPSSALPHPPSSALVRFLRRASTASPSKMTPSYIPHLDGIRALALAGVLLFHFEVPPFTGGYAGVDVFLTLSGYLITRNIGLSLHAKSSFSLRTFYVRRFFRLFPASLVCTLVAIVLALGMFPPELTLPAFRSALASVASVANVYFYSTTGYFDLDVSLKPLLHHWSLSLEEQYYLVWPPLLLLVVNCVPLAPRVALAAVLVFLTLASFVGALLAFDRFPSFTFFMLPTRVFQFAVGALYAVAYWPSLPRSRKDVLPTKSDTAAVPPPLRGLQSMLASSSSSTSPVSSVFTPMSECTPVSSRTSPSSVCSPPSFRSPKFARTPSMPSKIRHPFEEVFSCFAAFIVIATYVLLPPGASPLQVAPVTVATLILIALPDTELATRVLSHPNLAFVGRLSYSAYLVHWPIYVFLRYAAPAMQMPQPSAFHYTLLTFLCAILLHHGVEQPFRHPKAMHRFILFALTSATVALCILGIRANGFRGRSQEYFATGFPASEKERYFSHNVGLDLTRKMTNRTNGIISRVGAVHTGQRSKYVFFGDSFAAHLRTGMHVVGKRRNVWFEIHSTPGCLLWPEVYFERSGRPNHRCREQIAQMWREIAALPANSTIMLSNLWCQEPITAFKKLVYEMTDMVKRIGGHEMVIVGEPPGMSKEAQSYFACASFWQLPIGRVIAPVARWVTGGRLGTRLDGTVCADLLKGLEPSPCLSMRAAEVRAHMRVATHVPYVDVFGALCGTRDRNWKKDRLCRLPVYFDDRQLYNVGYQGDGSHYSPAGSYYVGVNILDKFMFGNATTFE